MLEVRFHGRGGQGAVTAAELLAVAAGEEGKFSQAFPFFGVERRGAPVRAFCRIDEKPIIIHEHVYSPDVVVSFDSTLTDADVFDGVREGSIVILNSTTPPVARAGLKVFYVDAESIARKNIGVPVVNTAMLGAFAKATGLVSLNALQVALKDRFGAKWEANFNAVQECFDKVVKL
ncbi:MAG: 2-oxoacid:acceptor oxidoreductase family protein [Candidatus Micrarchaeota archaeon]